jgi:DNA-binding NarL/FixJ family response regulator
LARNSIGKVDVLTGKYMAIKNKLHNGILTPREKEIVKQICSCKTDREIADELYISPLTAKKHRDNILHKLSLKNTAALILYAVDKGLN